MLRVRWSTEASQYFISTLKHRSQHLRLLALLSGGSEALRHLRPYALVLQVVHPIRSVFKQRLQCLKQIGNHLLCRSPYNEVSN